MFLVYRTLYNFVSTVIKLPVSSNAAQQDENAIAQGKESSNVQLHVCGYILLYSYSKVHACKMQTYC